jgi:hypothetical protein
METATVSYSEFLNKDWRHLMEIRQLGDWHVLSSVEGEATLGRTDNRVYLLLVVNETEETVIECRYDSWQERCQDVEMLRRLPPSGEAGAGVGAKLHPIVPTLTASAAKQPPAPPSEPEV